MSTRSNIAVRKKDGTIKVIYCHYDGYVEGVGLALYNHYNNAEKANELIALGDISSLADSIADTEKESYRTRGEDGDCNAREFKNYKDYCENGQSGWEEYIYIFDEETDKWIMVFPTFIALESVIAGKEMEACWQ